MIGIYKITNKLNNSSYIGKSINIYERWSEHKRESQLSEEIWQANKRHEQTYLHRAMRKYGIDNFSFEVIEECDKDKLSEREIYWISYYNTYLNPDDYNMTPGGDGYTCGPGEQAPGCKITQKECNIIKQKLKEHWTAKQIIQIVPNATHGIISSINHGHSWFDPKETYPISINNGHRKWSDEQAMIIKIEYAEGANIQDLAIKYQASPECISALVRGKSYTNLPVLERKVSWKRKSTSGRLTTEQVQKYRKEAQQNGAPATYRKYQNEIPLKYQAFYNMIIKKTYRDVADV